jgi:outer membrane protein OmpA-like peptidoglycan-associated protein
LAVPLWLGACAGSDADLTELFGGPTPKAERIKGDPSADDRPFPSIGSVPQAPPRPSTQRLRNLLTKGLLADRVNARYSGERLTARSTAVPPAQPPVPSASAGRSTAAVRRGTRPSFGPRPPGPPPVPPAGSPAVSQQSAALPPIAPPAPEATAAPGVTSLTPRRWALRPAAGPIARGELVGVIYFLGGSSRLDLRDRRILSDVLLLQRQRGGVLRLVGHASRQRRSPDPVAHRLAKFERSLARAGNVALAMLDLGADRRALEVIAAADSEPVYDESAETGTAGNRRVEIFLEN